jgi:hypothetical protein
MVLIFAGVAEGGDYWLTISDDHDSPCAESTRRALEKCEEMRVTGQIERCDLGEVLHDSTEVSEDLKRYFTGHITKIKILFPAFLNGHLTFCGNTERERVHRALIQIAGIKEIQNERALFDIISIYASSYMRDQCQIEKDSVSPGGTADKRMALIAKVIDKAIAKKNKK